MQRSVWIGLVLANLASPALFAKPWKSGEILSNQTFKYGAFEVRMKASRGDSAITSINLLKDQSWVPGQEWQELDFEVFGKDSAYKYQSQLITPGDPRVQHLKIHDSGQPLNEEFHIYRIEWAPDYLAFYFDGQMVRKETDRKEYGKFLDRGRVEPMNLRLSLWSGFSDWSGHLNPQALPTPTVIDWVRTFEYKEDSGRFEKLWEDSFDSFDSQRWSKADWTFEYAENDFTPGNVYTEGGYLNIYFSGQ